jgi:hypothetical protein
MLGQPAHTKGDYPTEAVSITARPIPWAATAGHALLFMSSGERAGSSPGDMRRVQVQTAPVGAVCRLLFAVDQRSISNI